ncbi:MAG: group II intron reverse transcriptase/maturase [Thermaerobacter sp.]|nr:group II intron reverse transcriptase/maturase [Thermaerobacter sp.]
MIISELQGKLATWSTEQPTRRFDRLLRMIADLTWLEEAARITLASRGAHTPGVDGVRKTQLEAHLADELTEIRHQLLGGTYEPQPARRVYIPKKNGKQRPLGIPTLRDRIVQRAMLMAMEPIWESDFRPTSYGFRPRRSVHHAIRAVRLQLLSDDTRGTAGRWVIEGDLSSYFDTVHHRLLMKALRRRICDARFLALLHRFIKAGHIDRHLFRATHQGVPQGGVISPLLSNIMLHEFDEWLETQFLSPKARKDRWAWNDTIRRQRPIAMRENRRWRPAVSYTRYADDFVVVVKGSKQDAEAVREACRDYLEGVLHLTLNMDKTHITHVNDGFVFLGHRIIRKRGATGRQRPVTTIPWEKYRAFVAKMVRQLSTDYGANPLDLIEHLNQQIQGWANFYRYTDYTATIFSRIDRVIFWKLGHWLARKYRKGFRHLMARHVRAPQPGTAKTWVLHGRTGNGRYVTTALARLVTSPKGRFLWRTPEQNPYILPPADRPVRYLESRYADVAIALSDT